MCVWLVRVRPGGGGVRAGGGGVKVRAGGGGGVPHTGRAQGRRPRREEARRPSSANVPDKMDRKNRLVYPLPLRTLKRVPVALRMSVSSGQSL